MSSMAGARRWVETLRPRLAGLRVSPRNLVAALRRREGGWLVVVTAENGVASHPRIADEGLTFVPLAELAEYDLGDCLPPAVAFSAVGAVRGELTAGDFFDAPRWLFAPEDAADLTATRTCLVEWLAREASADEKRGATFASEARRLRIAELLSRVPVEGLVAVMPGPDLETCDLEAQLFYVPGACPPPEDATYTFRELPNLESLPGPSTSENPLYVLGTLRPSGRTKQEIGELLDLLRDAGRDMAWRAGSGLLVEWLRQVATGANRGRETAILLAADPVACLRERVRASRSANGNSDPWVRIERLEEAYADAWATPAECLELAGVERFRTAAQRALCEALSAIETKDKALEAYCAAASLWYGGPKTESAETWSIDVAARYETFFGYSAVRPVEAARGRWLQELLVFARLLAGRAAGTEVLNRMRDGLAHDRSLEMTLRQLLALANLETSIRNAEQRGGDADQRAGILRGVAERIRTYVRFVPGQPHVRPLIAHVAEHLAMAAVNRANQLTCRPYLHLTPRTETIPLDEETELRIDIENRGAVTAKSVSVELLSSDAFSVAGGRSMCLHPEITPFSDWTLRFPVRFNEPGAFNYVLDVGYQADRETVHEPFTARVQVQSPAFHASLPEKPPTYPVGGVVDDPHWFFGHRHELRVIIQHLAGGVRQNFLLRGPRRTGKSSLLAMVRRVLEDNPPHEVRKLFELPSAWNQNLDQWIPVDMSAQAVEGRSGTRDRIFLEMLIDKVEEAVLKADSRVQRSPGRFVEDPCGAFREAVGELCARLPSSRRLVFLIDEFDTLHEVGLKGFFAAFRTIVDRDPRLVWILVSATGLRRASEQYGSPLFNLFLHLDLKTLSREDVARVVESPADGITFFDDALDEIYAQSGGNPYFANLLSNQIMEHLYEEPRKPPRVRRSTVTEAAARLIRTDLEKYVTHLWEGAAVDVFPVLSRIAAFSGPCPAERLVECDPAGTALELMAL